MSKLQQLLDGVRANPNYLQPDGSVGLTNEANTDNKFLFTATYHNMVSRLGGVDQAARDEFDMYVSGQQNPGRPGLYTPAASWDTPTISHDEIVGLSAYDVAVAADIADYGIWHGWLFNNLDYEWKVENAKKLAGQWHGRMGWVVPYVRLRARLPVGNIFTYFFNQLTFALQCWFTARNDPGQTSTRCMFYLMSSEVIANGPWIMRKAMEYFLRDCEKKYMTLYGLYRIYFGTDHPVTIASLGMPFDYRKGNGEIS